MKYTVEDIKSILYSRVICDVLDHMGYRNQAISGDIMPLTDDSVIFGPAFTSIGTQVYSMPEEPLTAQCKVVDQLGEDEIYVLVNRGEYTCAVFGELFANGVLGRKGAGVLLDGFCQRYKTAKENEFSVILQGKGSKNLKRQM